MAIAVRTGRVPRVVGVHQGDTACETGNKVDGALWTNTADLKMGLRNSADTYSRLTSDVTVYLSPVLSPQVTLAARVGGAHIVGEFPFYASTTLGGKTNLRGHRSTRFAGRTSVYANVDLRIEVLDFAGYLVFGKAGVLGFFDTGRVWTDGESSRVWHRGYGGGLWFELFRAMVLNGTFGFSDDDQTFTLQLGFQY